MDEIKWGGNWKSPYNGTTCGGELLISKKEGVIRLVIFHLQDNFPDLHATNLFPDEMPLLYGEISNGTKVTLLNCKVAKRHNQGFYRDTITIFAEEMFVGGEFGQEELRFDKITYVLSNIIEWSGLCKYVSEFEPSITLKWESQKAITVRLREGVDIVFLPQTGAVPIYSCKKELKLTQEVDVSFCYSSPVEFKDSLEDVKSLISLIDLGIEDNIYIEKVTCYRKEFIGERDRQIPIGVYLNQPQGSSFQPQIQYNLFTLQSLHGEKLLENWFNKYPKLKPVTDLYSTFFAYPQMPIEMVFLNTVQALETYHSRFICDSLKEYKEKVDSILERCPDNERDIHREQFLSETQRDKNINYIILKSRLCDLFICNFEFSFLDFYDEKFPYLLIDSIVDTRHYFTHYSSKKEQKALRGKKLNYAIASMRQVLEFYLLKEIGFSLEYIKVVIGRRQEAIIMQMKRELGGDTQGNFPGNLFD